MIDQNGTAIAASAFVPPAERYNMMAQIDRWVVVNALSTLQQRHAWENQSTVCWIGVSAAAIADHGFIDYAVEQLKRLQIPPHCLCFEISETTILANIDQATRFMAALSNYGVLVALDNFGGVSSFHALRLSPIQFLKIDSTLFANIANSPLDFALVKAINDVAHALDIKTVAEQIDSAETMREVRSIGVDFVQGFGISALEMLSTMRLSDELSIARATA